MATKTISIDVEAYERLKSVQQPEESFSQVIKRVIRPPFDVGGWLDLLRRHPISKVAGDAIEEQVRLRRQTSKRAR
jgi:predicted CopG family antitoxin